MRPIADSRHETVLDRVAVDAVDVPNRIQFVADRMLPKSPLPQRIFSTPIALTRDPAGDDVAREQAFDLLPCAAAAPLRSSLLRLDLGPADEDFLAGQRIAIDVDAVIVTQERQRSADMFRRYHGILPGQRSVETPALRAIDLPAMDALIAKTPGLSWRSSARRPMPDARRWAARATTGGRTGRPR